MQSTETTREKLPKPQQEQQAQQEHPGDINFRGKTARNSKPRNACFVQIDDQRKISQCTNQDKKKTATTTSTTKTAMVQKQTNMNKTEIFFFSLHFQFLMLYRSIIASRQVQQVCSFFVCLRAFVLHCTFWGMWISVKNRVILILSLRF